MLYLRYNIVMKQYGRTDKWYGHCKKRPGKFNINNKMDRKAWWRGLTAEQQADYLVRKKYKLGLPVDWQKEYQEVLKKNQYYKP